MSLPRLILAGLACALLSAQAQETLFMEAPKKTFPEDKTRVEAEALFSMPPPNGYLPVRITIVNQRKTDGSITIDTTASTSGGPETDSELTSEFRLNSKAESSSTHDLLVPLTTDLDGEGSTAQIIMGGSFGRSSGGVGSNFAPDSAAVLMSEALHTPNSSILDSELNGRSGGYRSYSFAARFEPLRMPEDWRAYVGYDSMILTDKDWNELPPGARSAIQQWVRLGGSIYIHRIGGTGSFNSLGLDGVPLNSGKLAYGYGSFHLESLAAGGGMKLDPKATVTRFSTGKRGTGSQIQSILNDYSKGWPLHTAFGKQEFSYALFIVVLVAFGVLVGPVNLFVFAKSGQRHKLFITTPIISLATSAILIMLILAKDGVGGRGMRVTLMEVMPGQNENRAYVIQEQVSRTGVLVGSSFELSEDATITPVPIAKSPWSRLYPGIGGGGMRYTARFDEGSLGISGDWFQSRSEQGQQIQAVIPTRGRIEKKSTAGAPVLNSTFEFPIQTLYYRDGSGGFWKAENLEAGNSVQATSISRADYELARDTEGARLARQQQKALIGASKREDHYFALSSEAPAIETFDSIEWIDSHTIITGPILP